MDDFNEQFAAIITEQLLKALNCCHANKIIYGDLAPSDIHIIDDYKGDDMNIQVKLINFGSFVKFDEKKNREKDVSNCYY